jgi:fructokinase
VITVVGENVVDLIPAGDGLLRPALGGGPANTAVAAARLGAPVAFAGRFGADAFAAALRQRLDAAGVRLDPARTAAAPSALALASLDAAGVARYDFWLDGAADFGTASADELPAPAPGDILHIGSLAAFWPPGADAIEAWIRRWRDRALVSVDVNLRPVVLEQQRDARERLARLVRLAHVVKASDEDATAAAPGEDPLDVARGWLDAGARLVVLTRGAAGATGLARGPAGETTEASVPAPAVPVADTIGAGDAAMGALLGRLHAAGVEGVAADLAETLRYVCTAAAIACTRPGAYAPDGIEVAAALAGG